VNCAKGVLYPLQDTQQDTSECLEDTDRTLVDATPDSKLSDSKSE
jgi:hypothetical protein